MHVMVLGAGVIGVTTAWHLLNAGFEVSIVDRQAGAGLETTYANGGQISISHPEPWSSPSAPWIALRALGCEDSPLRFGFGLDAARWRWLAGFLHECLPARHRRNTHAIASLAAHSGACLRGLRERTGLEYAQQTRGILHVLHTERELEQARARIVTLAQHGIPASLCSAAECAALDPALDHLSRRLAGGLFAPDDESGDAQLFTRALAEHVAQAGGRFHYDTRVTRISRRGDHVDGVEVTHATRGKGLLCADAYVLCLGSFSAKMAASIGEHLPIYPIKGYSVTVPVTRDERAPKMSLTDESRRIVCSRLGDRLRVAGTAEMNGFDATPHASRCAPLLRWIEESFPDATDVSEAQLWAGLRPCTPSYVPIIGKGKAANLWLNTGHGSLGWTLSCGSAEVLTALVSGREPAVQDFPYRR